MSICRVFEQPDGSLLVVHPNPSNRWPLESEAKWLARVWARTVEAQPELAGLPFHDVDTADLPLRQAACQDGCGEEHPVRDQWRLAGTGRGRRVAVDATLRNPHAEIRHLDRAAANEVGKARPDAGTLALIDATRRGLQRHQREGGPAPSAALVADLTAAVRRPQSSVPTS